MAGSEFEIIRRYFSPFGTKRDWLAVGIGDDAAVITPPADRQLLVSIDTLNAGIHFPQHTLPIDIGYKALAVNLSDIASMGGEPQWFTLAISLPSSDDNWLTAFCDGIAQLVDKYDLTLIGGDTTRGPLSITIQIAGHVPTGQALLRSGATVGDDIYVTGQLGDAATGLLVSAGKLQTDTDSQKAFLHALNRPSPRVATGLGLRNIANACIDISDGLAADLGHILDASHVGAEIVNDAIPISGNLRQLNLSDEQLQQRVLFGGDDYELCFTASTDYRSEIEQLSVSLQLPITRIGSIIKEPGLFYLQHGKFQPLPIKGYDHFA